MPIQQQHINEMIWHYKNLSHEPHTDKEDILINDIIIRLQQLQVEQPRQDVDIDKIMEDIWFKSDRAYGNIVLHESTIRAILTKHLTQKTTVPNDGEVKYKTAIHLITEYENDKDFNKFWISNKITDFEMWLRLQNSK